jgi:hypothetical protein
MKSDKHRECKRQFVVTGQAWYAEACKRPDIENEITIGLYHPEGGTTGEFSIKWTLLQGKNTPYLKAYNDSWSALQEFSDFLEALSKLDGTDPTEDEVIAVLLKCGVEDATERVRRK